MKNSALLSVLGASGAGLILYKWSVVSGLSHFSPSEFRGHWVFLSADLLKKLDLYRDNLGYRVLVSPAPGSMFRVGGSGQHPWGKAIDVMLPDGPDLNTAYQVAIDTGFKGIGVYPDWSPYPGLHLDVRAGDLETWGGVMTANGQEYVAVETVLT